VSVVIGASYFLSIYRKTFFGQITNEVVRNAVDLQPRELAIHAVLILLVLGLGLFPSLILELLDSSTTAWINHLNIP
jgi:NADH-quinone oxidoreductase subunit M